MLSAESFMQSVHSRWVDFGLIKNSMHLHDVCGSPRYNTRQYQISLTFVLTTNKRERYHFKGPYFQKKIQGQNIKNQKILFLEK